MNFSAPLNFQMSFNNPHAYYPQSHPYPQQSEQIPISKLFSKEVQWQTQHGALPGQLWSDDKELAKYDPIKKIKVSNAYGLDFDNAPAHLLHPSQRNETIINKNMTSSFHTGCVSSVNYLDQKLCPNQILGLNKNLNPRNEPKPVFEDAPDHAFPMNPRILQGYDNRYGMHPMASHGNSMREWPVGFPQQFPSNQVPATLSQLNLLQNLQIQMANSQKAYENLLVKNMNPMMQNQMYYNPHAVNSYRNVQNEQYALSMALNTQNQLKLGQEAQRKQAELAVTTSTPVKEQMPLTSSKTQIEPISFEDFPEIPLDHTFFPDLLMLGNESPYERLAPEDLKAKDFDDSDDKKTSATSVSTSNIEDGLSKEISHYYNFDFQTLNQSLKQQVQKEFEQKNQQQKLSNQNKQKKDTEKTLLKKRDFDMFEKSGQNLKKDQTDKIKEKEKEKKKTLYGKVQVTEAPQLASSGNLTAEFSFEKNAMREEKLFNSFGIHMASHETGAKASQLLKPLSPADNIKKIAKSPSPAGSSKEAKPVKKEKKIKPDVKTAIDSKQEELKKLYSFPGQTEVKDTELKIEKTRVGRAYQVRVERYDYNRVPQRRERTIKSLWNPALIEPEKIEGFIAQLTEIFQQEVTNEEAALKILRGTGMDVDSTVDILRRNSLYFKAILFPEPKPTKPQKSYWV